MYVLDEDESAPGLVTCLKDYNGVTRVYLGQFKILKVFTDGQSLGSTCKTCGDIH